MPSAHTPCSPPGKDGRMRADFVIGDRFGTSCARQVADMAEDALEQLGYLVERNKPYAGGFITEHYGHPASGRHTLQIEVNRALYMDERLIEPNENFGRVAGHLSIVLGKLAETMHAGLGERPIAAE